MIPTYSIEQFAARAILQEDEVSLVFRSRAVTLDNVRVFQQLVDANLLPHGLCQLGGLYCLALAA